MSDVRTRFDLQPDQIPTAWFNLVPDMVKAGMQPLPPLSPQTKEPMGPADLAPLFPESLIMQEVSAEPWIDIPGEVIDIYRLWRPSPLFRATRLERALDTPARIYFKYEGVSPAGSHKPNTAVPQAFYNQQAGIRRIATETGAGQWGSSMAHGVQHVRPGVRRVHGEGVVRAEAVPAGVHGDVRRLASWPRPATRPTAAARSWKRTPTRRVRSASRSAKRWRTPRRTRTRTTRWAACWATCSCTSRSSGSRPSSRWRWRASVPTSIVGCVGGGSNYAGSGVPVHGRQAPRRDAPRGSWPTEPAACPTLTKGRFAYDYGDTAADRSDRADVHAGP